jgi:hypothetical protein
MVRAALRRLLFLIGGIVIVIAVVSVVIGVLAGSNLGRAVSIGFYLVGTILLASGVFIGSRGPVRSRNPRYDHLIGPRLVRWATPQEQEQVLNDSAILVLIGFVLVVIGLVVDGRHSIF